MSEKELFFQPRHWMAWLSTKWRMALMVLFFFGVMWATPLVLKWLLVQQLQQALRREVSVDAVQVHPMSLSIDVQGVSIQNTQGGELAGWQRLTVDVSAQSFAQRALVLDALTLHGPRVSVVHLGQGRFDFSDLLEPSKDNGNKALPLFVLHEVSIHNGRIAVEDRPHQRTHRIENLKLALPSVSSVAGHNGQILRPELSATLNGALVRVGGTVQPLADAPSGVLALTLDAFDVSGLQAYVPDSLRMRLARGTLSADLKLAFSEASGRMVLLLNGTAHVQDLVLNDVRDRALLSFKTLGLTLSPSDVLAGHVQLSSVMLDEPKATVRIGPDGHLNGSAALPPVQTQPSQPSTDSSNASPALAMHIEQFTLRDGSVEFSDASVKPAVQSRMTDMNAVVNNISTQANTPADMTLKAKLNGKAMLDVQARMQPFKVTSFLDAKVQAKHVDLTHFSGYAQKYLGYPLDKGKLSLEAIYRIKDQQLQADNHVLIDHLTLGAQVPSPYAIDAPVLLGVSLLKNSSGQIDIDLPVSGTVDAPEFSFGGLVAQTIGHVLVKIVTAPVRAIGSLVVDDDKPD